MKSKAAILVEQNKSLVVDEIQFPQTPLKYGQVLVKIAYSGICGSQLGEIDGVKGIDKYLPHLLGHEGSGEVLEIGEGVKVVKPGDKVVLHWRKGNGTESEPPIYEWRGKKLNAGFVTTFNEYAIVSENRVTRIPENTDMQIAALFGCAVTTGFGVVVNNAKLKPGESVIVYGAGGVGLSIIQAAAMVSAYPIIAVDRFTDRLSLAGEMGATHLRSHLGNNEEFGLVDCFIDNTGNTSIIELGYSITKPQGRIICVGVPESDQNITIHSLPLHFGKTIIGSHGGESNPSIDIPRYLNLCDDDFLDNIYNTDLYHPSRKKLKSLITDIYPLEEINTAISGMRLGKTTGRCLIKMHD